MRIPKFVYSLDNSRLVLAAEAALRAGRIIGAGYKQVCLVKEKGVGDLFSEIDLSADRKVHRVLREGDGESDIISEESPPDIRGSSSRWIVDPLDGSAAFLFKAGRGKPSVMIAHQSKGITDVAVIFLPLSGEWFYAVLDGGAFTGEGVSLTARKPRPLQEAWVEMNQYGESHLDSAAFTQLHMLLRSRAGARLVTSSVPHSAIAMRVLTGEMLLDAVVHDNDPLRVKQALWDVAAPQLIVEEAGGVVLDLYGERYNPLKPQPFVIAGSRTIVEDIGRIAFAT